MDRRTFLAVAATAAVGGLGAGPATRPTGAVPPVAVPNRLPRWRGFNLLNLFEAKDAKPFDEADFALLAEWGFDFVRVPASYWCWSSAADQHSVREAGLAPVDRAVQFGRAYGVHVNLNLHRLPGFSVRPPKEPNDLWTDPAAVDAAAAQWTMLAKRYRGTPAAALSFDLINEPEDDVKADVYVRVCRRLVEAVRGEDADRPIVADGLKWGTEPVAALAEGMAGQSAHWYDPMRLTHHAASWIHGSDKWAVPTWPMTVAAGDVWDKARLKRARIDPWVRMQAATGVGIHVGEFGTYNRTPHGVALAWMADCLDLWRAAGWGWSLWNLYGPFGVLDSGRKDVAYEPFRGRQLDRKMLELLRAG